MANVDWSKPIEAVHVDGRVCAANVSRFSATGDSVLVRYSDYEDETEWYDTRLPGHSKTGWHIRNVQTPEAEHPAIDPALVERMVELMRDMANCEQAKVNGMLFGLPVRIFNSWVGKATVILEALEPVDPDRTIAEEIAASYPEGEYEAVALAAIKRGRELERERGEAK